MARRMERQIQGEKKGGAWNLSGDNLEKKQRGRGRMGKERKSTSGRPTKNAERKQPSITAMENRFGKTEQTTRWV